MTFTKKLKIPFDENELILDDSYTEIEFGAFNNYIDAESIILGNGITELPPLCFSNFSYLKKIKLPAALKNISGKAFDGCISIEEIELPAAVEQIGFRAFDGCKSLKKINLSDTKISKIEKECFLSCSSLEEIQLPASVKEIDESAFKNSGIRKITLPDSLEAIGPEAFCECKNLESVNLPSTLKKIGSSAFASSALKEILIPESAETGSSAFYKCGELTKATVKNPNGMVSNYIFSYCKNLQEVNLPQGLTSIRKGCFSGCTKLKEITLPSTCTSIEDSVFSWCSALEKISGTENLEYIGDRAFSSCSSLRKIEIPKAKRIRSDCFIDSPNLERIPFPQTATHLSNFSFFFPDVTEYIIPESITGLETETFVNCPKLERIEFNENIILRKFPLFNGCVSLKEIVFKKMNVQTWMFTDNYGNHINFFAGCVNLEKIIFPEGCTLAFENGVLWDKSTGEAFCSSPFRNEKTLVIPDGVKIFHTCGADIPQFERIEIPSSLIEVKGSLYHFPEEERNRIKSIVKAKKEFAEAKKQKIADLIHAGNQGRLDILLKDFNFAYTSRNSDKTPPGIITELDLNFGCKFKIRTPMEISEEIILLLRDVLESFAAAASAEEMNSAMNTAVKTLKSNKIFARIESEG